MEDQKSSAALLSPPALPSGSAFTSILNSGGFTPQSVPLSSAMLNRPSLDLYGERRTSLPLSPIVASPNPDASNRIQAGLSLDTLGSGSSEDGTFYKRMKIDVHQPVGNMSISPSCRDVVLAARKGLFIIDLDNPYAAPRFLPQGGTWEVADVQWNPHPCRQEYIVSTSSQKLLIWNLYKTGQTSIEYILNKHFRAITDINWSPFNPDVIASSGIDSWIWAWDMRQGARPIFGMCAWDAPATQVKWNRQDEYIVASSHDDKVLIWDHRKGSLPLLTIPAHQGAKIYGIDWSFKYRNEIVTCSLDKSIKFWTIDALSARCDDATHDTLGPAQWDTSRLYPQHEYFPDGSMSRLGTEESIKPRHIIRTRYPVWRARHLPFGYGVLSLPQRGETELEMWKPDASAAIEEPIYTVDGHTDVVKEYVWRWRGGADPEHDDREFQLVTWSKDRTLRLWPIDSSTMKAAGHVPGTKIKIHLRRAATEHDSPADHDTFRLTPSQESTGGPEPQVSAPLGNRSILAGVQAGSKAIGMPNRRSSTHATAGQKGTPSSAGTIAGRHRPALLGKEKHDTHGRPTVTSGWMTRGIGASGRPGPSTGPGGFGEPTISRFTSVTVERRNDSGGFDSSGPASRIASKSRTGSADARLGIGLGLEGAPVGLRDLQNLRDEDRGRKRGRSGSRLRTADGTEVGFGGRGMPESLGDELTSIGRRFGTRVTCERADVTRKRICTFTLLGPWRGDNGLVFIRISFSFPKDYWKYGQGDPNATRSIPSFYLDKIPGITLKTRAFLLKKLRNIRYTRRPCLEPCLLFLLGEEETFGLAFRGAFGLSEGSRSDGDEEDDGAVDDDLIGGLATPWLPPQEGRGRLDKPPLAKLKNTLENSIRPRRCGAVFGPGGELVCFFLNTSSARVYSSVNPGRRNASPSPSIVSRSTSDNFAARPFTSSVGTISHAMRGLYRLTNDKSGMPPEPEVLPRNPWTEPLQMDTLFIGPVLRSATDGSRDTRASSNPAQRSLSSVSIKLFPALDDLKQVLARDYEVFSDQPATFCETNAAIAKAHGRYDHQRVWNSLYQLFRASVFQISGRGDEQMPPMTTEGRTLNVRDEQLRWSTQPLARKAIQGFYQIFASKKDLQMLAMLSVMLLQAGHFTPIKGHDTRLADLRTVIPTTPAIAALPISPRVNIDYFSLRPRDAPTPSPTTPSPSAHHKAPSFSSNHSLPSPSRNSWTNRFLSASHGESPPQSLGSGKRRERTISAMSMATTSDSPRTSFYSALTPSSFAEAITGRSGSIPVPAKPVPGTPVMDVSPRKRGFMSPSASRTNDSGIGGQKSWSELAPAPNSRMNVMFSTGGYGKRWSTLAGGTSAGSITRAPTSGALTPVRERKKAITVSFHMVNEELPPIISPYTNPASEQYACEAHIIAYAEVLFRWGLLQRRAELLKTLGRQMHMQHTVLALHEMNGIQPEVQLDIRRACSKCGSPDTDSSVCERCRENQGEPSCTVCRLPVHGLAHSCLRCCHVSHYRCWKAWLLRSKHPLCATGCGCSCGVAGGGFDVDAPKPALELFSPGLASAVTDSAATSRLHSPDVEDIGQTTFDFSSFIRQPLAQLP